ncbi:MAG: hypothetical protein RIA71_02580 [Oceanicaulis sp.]
MRPLLILGSKTDPHTSWPLEALGRDIRVEYFDFGDPACDITTSPDNGYFSNMIKLGAREKEKGSRPLLVWLRNKYKILEIKNKENQFNYFIYKAFLDIFASECINYKVDHFNPINALTRAENKIRQLRVAQRCGLRIPKTIMTNVKSTVLDFADHNRLDQVIVKPPCMGFLPKALDGSPAESILANRVHVSQLLEMSESAVGEAPLIYQEEIGKAFELRVLCTHFGSATFKIDSQKSELGRIDSRRATFEKIYSEASLPVEVIEKLRHYLSELGLVYGIFDLVMSRDGEVVFLECNPDGQWAWLEKATGSTAARNVKAEMLTQLLR